MLILSFVILSVMPLMAGFLVNLIANGEEGKSAFFSLIRCSRALYFFSAVFLSVLSLSLVLWFKVLVPLGNLSQAARQVSKGRFSIKVETGKSLRELRELTDNFNRMVQELGSIESFRNDFVTNISHEFKTPLAAIEEICHPASGAFLPRKTGMNISALSWTVPSSSLRWQATFSCCHGEKQEIRPPAKLCSSWMSRYASPF